MKGVSLIDELLEEQRSLSAVDRFARWHEALHAPAPRPISPDDLPTPSRYQRLLPATAPGPGQQYSFEVDLDQCSGCKACVTACHALNGLDEEESWRSVGLLVTPSTPAPITQHAVQPYLQPLVQHVTTACHHCADPGCLNGCPVLAYDKDPATGIVRHLDDQCMGCSYCVMKCPYEVPRYSQRLGIVRKCDLCSRRLAAQEAPACAQACPNEAIRITLVSTAEIGARYRPNPAPDAQPVAIARAKSAPPEPNPFLPDSPNPALTLPTTQFVSRRARTDAAQAGSARAADHDRLRLDTPHHPLTAMLVLTQLSAGLLTGGTLLGLFAPAVAAAHAPLLLGIAAAALGLGLTASVLHLGRPMKAWRAFLGWRHSWLSREIIAFQAFAPLALLAWLASTGHLAHPGSPTATALAAAAALVGLAGVAASAMVYADTGRPAWNARLAFGNFFGTTLLLGATGGAALLALSATDPASPTARAGAVAAVAALVIRTSLFLWRRQGLRNALAHPDHPLHWNARVAAECLAPSLRMRTTLFVISTTGGLAALAQLGQATAVWATISALSTLASEWLARHAWFAAGGARRMPGGPAA